MQHVIGTSGKGVHLLLMPAGLLTDLFEVLQFSSLGLSESSYA
jgi:hypothetical protein